MTLKVRIVSMFALCNPEREQFTWEGEIEVPEKFRDTSPIDVCEHLYRVFNRVDPSDSVRLEEVAYRLPSMSVGDLVAFWEPDAEKQRHVDYHRVGGFGFQRYMPGFDAAL